MFRALFQSSRRRMCPLSLTRSPCSSLSLALSLCQYSSNTILRGRCKPALQLLSFVVMYFSLPCTQLWPSLLTSFHSPVAPVFLSAEHINFFDCELLRSNCNYLSARMHSRSASTEARSKLTTPITSVSISIPIQSSSWTANDSWNLLTRGDTDVNTTHGCTHLLLSVVMRIHFCKNDMPRWS